MEIMYTDETLYVSLIDEVDEYLINKMENRVFKIIDDYDIRNICLKIVNEYDSTLLDKFIYTYKNKYEGKIEFN